MFRMKTIYLSVIILPLAFFGLFSLLDASGDFRAGGSEHTCLFVGDPECNLLWRMSEEACYEFGLNITSESTLPADLSPYDMLIIGNVGDPEWQYRLNTFSLEWERPILLTGNSPWRIAGTDLSEIVDWFGASNYGTDGGKNTVVAHYPPCGIHKGDVVSHHKDPWAAGTYNLRPSAIPIVRYGNGSGLVSVFVNLPTMGKASAAGFWGEAWSYPIYRCMIQFLASKIP